MSTGRATDAKAFETCIRQRSAQATHIADEDQQYLQWPPLADSLTPTSDRNVSSGLGFDLKWDLGWMNAPRKLRGQLC